MGSSEADPRSVWLQVGGVTSDPELLTETMEKERQEKEED
jgi:hypothetical protein